MSDFNKTAVINWLLSNLTEGNFQNFVGIDEIQQKINIQTSNTALGNLISKLFKNLKVKKGRCLDDWTKKTQRYYGLAWKISSENFP